jgi:(E)-4-hydroxy-3-methyl-but-2-enyl pyrophosphate reductase
MKELAIRRVLLASPRGFCAGVDRAIEIVGLVLELYGPPVYVFHEIVHNPYVVRALRERGAVFVGDLAQVPPGARTVYSAHGVSPEVRAQAQARGLLVTDATCPLVTKVHLEAARFARAGYFNILVGHPGHDEVLGTMGEVPGSIALVSDATQAEAVAVPDPNRVAVLTQQFREGRTDLPGAKDDVKVLRHVVNSFRNNAAPPIVNASTTRHLLFALSLRFTRGTLPGARCGCQVGPAAASGVGPPYFR